MNQIGTIEASHMGHQLRKFDRKAEEESQKQDLPPGPHPFFDSRKKIPQRHEEQNIQYDLRDPKFIFLKRLPHALQRRIAPAVFNIPSQVDILPEWIKYGADLHFRFTYQESQEEYTDHIEEEEHLGRLHVINASHEDHHRDDDGRHDYRLIHW